nr:hypothetical protein JVH1_4178 [Rhodococcus sp. JVH1]
MEHGQRLVRTVAVAQKRAKKKLPLPKSVDAAIITGSEKGVTVEDNTAASPNSGSHPRGESVR